MGEIWKSARDGFVGAFSLFWALAKVLLIYLPCIALLALPAMAVGYCWCWIVGGFRAGELAFESGFEQAGKGWRLKIEVHTPTPGDGDE